MALSAIIYLQLIPKTLSQLVRGKLITEDEAQIHASHLDELSSFLKT